MLVKKMKSKIIEKLHPDYGFAMPNDFVDKGILARIPKKANLLIDILDVIRQTYKIGFEEGQKYEREKSKN